MALDWLNLHHLLYFRAVAREGGVARAAERLRVSPATVSAQVKQLEGKLGDALFLRTRRRLVLTDLGHTVLRYADGIFDLGEELKAAVRHGELELPERLTVHWFSILVQKHVGTFQAVSAALIAQGLLDNRQHVDVSIGALGLGPSFDAHHPGLHNRDGLAPPIYLPPL